MSENKTNDETKLFPEVKIGDEIIKPWSFGKLFQLSELLEIVLDKMEQKGLDIDKEFAGGILKYTTVARLFTIASPEVLKIISITLDKSEEDVQKLSMEDGIKVSMTIWEQNINILKNVLTRPLEK